MSWKKNNFSYFMWFLYTLFTVAVLMLATEAQAEKLFGEIPFGGLIPGFGIAGLTGVAVYLIQWYLEHKRNKAKPDTFSSENAAQSSTGHGARVVWEIFDVVALLAVGLILRLDRITDGQGELFAYYEAAMVMEGQVIPSVVHGVDYLYLYVLHLLFLFVGNKFVAGVWLQIILQLLAVLMLFASMRKLAGPAAALVMLGFFMFAGTMIDGAVMLSPQMIYLLLFAIGINFLAECQKGSLHHLAFLGVGIWIGLMGYLDIGGFLLLILLVSCAAGDSNVETDRGKKLGAFCFGLMGTLAGFLGAIGADAIVSGKAFGSVLDAWLGLYDPGDFQSSILFSHVSTGWWTVVLAVFMIAGVFGFWCDKERDRMSMWVLGGCATAAAGCFGMFTEELPMDLYLYLFLGVLAGLGVGEIFNEPVENESEDLEAETPEESEMAKKEKKEKNRKNKKGEMEATAAKTQETQASTEVPAAEEMPAETPAVSRSEDKSIDEPEAEKPKSPKYIENPLPLPKPHVKRIMDYARKPTSGEDDFDHPVGEDDDFDI